MPTAAEMRVRERKEPTLLHVDARVPRNMSPLLCA